MNRKREDEAGVFAPAPPATAEEFRNFAKRLRQISIVDLTSSSTLVAERRWNCITSSCLSRSPSSSHLRTDEQTRHPGLQPLVYYVGTHARLTVKLRL